MFGHNKIVGQKFFREAAEARAGMLLVTSIFHTLQGEGPYAGMPAVFIRLAYCQLACAFCDTYFDSGDWYEVEPLLDAAAGAVMPGASAPPLLVITGGEPTLQAAGLRALVERALGGYAHIQIESNGLIPAELPAYVTVVVSPKAPGGHYNRLPDAALARADCLKFIISADPDSPYREVPDWAREWAARQGRPRALYVSPMAEYLRTPAETEAVYASRAAPSMAARSAAERISFWEPGLLDMDKCRRNHEYAAAYAMRHGYSLSIQMHLFASLP
jgi:organic radical activating enzyme